MSKTPALLTVALVAALVPLATLASPASAQAGDFRCDASALRASLLGAATIEPVTAGRGAAACGNVTGGPAVALPVPLSAAAITARTVVTGSADKPTDRAAIALGGLADVRVSALPELPITLPIDTVLAALPTLPAIPVPALLQPLLGASLSLDIEPALTALLPDGRLPNVDLVSAQAAVAYAGARCNAGKTQLFGTSTIAGVKILGQDVVVDGAVQRTLNLIDTASVDPSAIDPIGLLPANAVTDILGNVLLAPILTTVLAPTIQAALDALPTIEVPATLANVQVSAGEQTQANGILTQHALRITASIAGQPLADVLVGEARTSATGVDCTATAASAPTPTAPTTTAALQCTKRRLVLEDAVVRGDLVRLRGVADRKLVGRRVSIRFLASGRVVATAVVQPDGTFTADAAIPPASVRSTNSARYQASVGREKSLDLKLERRMVVTGVRVRAGKVTISGRVTKPFTSPASTITVTRRLSCKRSAVVAHVKPRSDGTFRVTVAAPDGQLAAVYRLGTYVREQPGNPRRYPTFTLPRAVDLT